MREAALAAEKRYQKDLEAAAEQALLRDPPPERSRAAARWRWEDDPDEERREREYQTQREALARFANTAPEARYPDLAAILERIQELCAEEKQLRVGRGFFYQLSEAETARIGEILAERTTAVRKESRLQLTLAKESANAHRALVEIKLKQELGADRHRRARQQAEHEHVEKVLRTATAPALGPLEARKQQWAEACSAFAPGAPAFTAAMQDPDVRFREFVECSRQHGRLWRLAGTSADGARIIWKYEEGRVGDERTATVNPANPRCTDSQLKCNFCRSQLQLPNLHFLLRL